MDTLIIIGSFLIEILIPVVIEIFIEIAVWFWPQGFKKYDWLSLWALCGGILGWATTLFLPYQVLGDSWAFALHVMISPLVCGIIIHQIGNSRQRRNKVRFRFESFWGGALFCLTFILIRLFFLSFRD